MTDAFALLAEVRRPWVDPDILKTKFREISAEFHPDRVLSASPEQKAVASSHFADLNSACNTLRESRERLLHLITLETGSPPKDIQRIPPGTMDHFIEVGQACRDCDAFLPRLKAATSPMLKLQVMREAMEWASRLQDLQERIVLKQAELERELQSMNATWEAAPTTGNPGRMEFLPMERLEQIYRSLSYTSRWTEQLRERTVQLAMA